MARHRRRCAAALAARGRWPSSSARPAAPAADAPLRVIVFGAHPGRLRPRRRRHRRALGGEGPRRSKFVSLTNGDAGHQTRGRRRAREAAARGGAGGGAPPRHRRVRGARQPRRRARADARRAPAGDPPHPPVERRRRDRPAAERLPPRPPLHRRPGPGRGVHGHRAERLPGHAAAAEEPGLPLLPGRLPAAEPVPPRRGGGDRLGDREEDRTRSTPTSRRSTSGSPGWTGVLDTRAEGPRGADRLAARSSGAAGRSPRTCGPRCGSGTGRGPTRVQRRRGLRGLRVRPAARPRPTCAGSSRSSTEASGVRGSGPGRGGCGRHARRERAAAERRPALDARGLERPAPARWRSSTPTPTTSPTRGARRDPPLPHGVASAPCAASAPPSRATAGA